MDYERPGAGAPFLVSGRIRLLASRQRRYRASAAGGHGPFSECRLAGSTSRRRGPLHLSPRSELLWWLDEKEEARRLHHQATELKRRFNDAFWMPDLEYFAMALDGEKRPVKSIGSNAGHCLAAGIVEEPLVRQTADRLFAADMFTGWGIRTLSDRNPAYNPYSYHRGSVWPVEHGSFAAGFTRYRLHDHVERICRAQFEAASLFDFYRLPELFTGHPRGPLHIVRQPSPWSLTASFGERLKDALSSLLPGK